MAAAWEKNASVYDCHPRPVNGYSPSPPLRPAMGNRGKACVTERLDDCLGHQGGRIDLTDPAYSRVRVDPDEQRFSATVAAFVDLWEP